MAEIKDGGPAFPVSTGLHEGEYGHQDGPQTWQFPGMTLRDYFAAKAMQADYGATQSNGACVLFEEIATRAYIVADAMLRAREANHG